MTAPVAPHPQSPPDVPTPPRPDRGPLVQRVLLGAGALCVLVAGAVYLAVSWHRIGTTGQTAFALVVTALAAAAAHGLGRRQLRASAEAFAAVAAGLLALDLAGAHHLDVLGAGRMEWWLWLTVAGGVVLVVAATLASASRLVTYRVVAVAAVAVLPATGGLAAHHAGFHPGAGTTSVVALAVASALVALAVVIGRRDAVTAGVAVLGGSGWWLFAAGAGVVAGWSSRPLADVVPAAVTWGAVAVALLVAGGRALAAGRGGDARIVVSVAGPIAAAPAALVLAGGLTACGAVATVVAAAAVAGLWALPRATAPAVRPVAVGAVVSGAVLVPASVGRGFAADVVGTLVLLLGAAAVGGTVHTRGAVRIVAAAAALLALVTGTGVLAIDRAAPALWLAGGWTTIAMALVLFAAFIGTSREGVLAAGGLIGVLAAAAGFAAQALDSHSPALTVALLGVGSALLVHGVVRTSHPVVVVGAAAVALAAVDLAAVARVEVVEAYTLPIAAVALLAGLLGRVGRPALSSWAWAAPAVLVAAVPSTAVALTDPGVTRLAVTAVAAAALVTAGVRWQLAAPVLLGAAVDAVLAVSQLAPYAVGAPRWISLAAAGAVLLTLGVLFERTRRSATAAARWCGTLR